MTLYSYADPEAEFLAALQAEAGRFDAGATFGTSHPATLTATHHIQLAWDGTPSDEAQREFTTMRVTYWTPGGRRTDAKNGASVARAVLLEYASAGLWRVTRGAGRTPGTDDDTGNEFCTFTLTAETRPSPVV